MISVVAVAAQRWRVPYTVILVLTGLATGAILRNVRLVDFDGLAALAQIQLTPRLVLNLLLPALIFEATLHIEARALRQTLVPIALLAIPGVALTAGLVGLLIAFGIGLDWQTAFLFGALIAATDPIAVLSIFRRIGAPRELELLVEGESIFNDGTAVVLTNVLKTAIIAGSFSWLNGGLEFVGVVAGGVIIGLIAGAIVVRVLSTVNDHLIEITLTTILTYGTFLIAESLHVSGIIAVTSAGLVLGNIGARYYMSPTTRLALLNFWEYAAFLINSVIFLLIGLQINLLELLQKPLPLLIAVVAVLLARAVVVYGLGLTILPFVKKLPTTWLHAVYWAAPRGAVSLAIVFALPVELPARNLLIDLTFGVVLFTLLLQTLTMETLLRRLGITGVDAEKQLYLTSRAKRLILIALTRELEKLKSEAALSPKIYEQISRDYRREAVRLDRELEKFYQQRGELIDEEAQRVLAHLLRIERTTLLDLQRNGMIDNRAARKLLERIDAQLIKLDDDNTSSTALEDAVLTGEEGTLAPLIKG